MGLSSLHVCMDSSDHWLQGTIHDEGGIMESSSSPSGGGEMLTCSTRPSMIAAERRLRPPHDQSLKCPRCDSTHTKFCYYNNYSLSQPRYFCKTCRRYWTKGGTLRNIPVGGGCRKNKKVSSKKSNNNNNNDPLLANTSTNQQNHHQLQSNAGPSNYNHHHHKDLQLSFPDVQFNSNLSNILGNNNSNSNNHSSFMESKYGIGPINGMLENPIIRPIDFIMESKLEGIIGNSSRNFDFFGNGEMGMANVGLGGDHMNMNNNGHHHHHHHGNGNGTNFHGLFSTTHHHASFGGMSLDGSNNGGNFMMDSSSSSCQRLMLPYDAGSSEDHNNNNAPIDVKPNPKLLSLEWQQEQGCSDAGKESFGYGSWSGMMNGYGSSATNPLV